MAENKEAQQDYNRFVTRVKWYVAIILILIGVPLYIYAFYLDSRLSSIDKTIGHLPPEQLDSDVLAHGDIFHLSANPVQGQVVYVPAYSHVYHGDGDPHFLTITLSIRNTNLDKEIVVKSIRYFDTKGKLVKSHLEKPVRLPALATTEVVVKRDERLGGSGANFLVEWYATQPVTEPIIEAVMIDIEKQQGVSFVRRGSVIKVLAPQKPKSEEEPADDPPNTPSA